VPNADLRIKFQSQIANRQSAMTRMIDGPFQPTKESLATFQAPAWYRDAKFGIFVHWGVYSVPAFGSEWYPRNMYMEGSKEFEHHLKTYGPHKDFGYKDFIGQFKAERFDPDAWANLFRRAGAKYVVPVAEHHDGFQMYDSNLSEWNATKMGPRRDVIGELAAACRRQFLTFGLSSHRAEHWFFFEGGMRFESDVRDPRYAGLYGPARPQTSPPSDEFLDDWLARSIELVDKYQPQLVYFDWWIEEPAFERHLRRFAAHYYNRGAQWGRGVAINFKLHGRPQHHFPETAGVFDVERGQLADIRPLFWQTDTATAKNSWGYTENNQFKSPTSIVHDLIDIVSKNGTLLLNVGPKADGTICAEDEQILTEIGDWLAVNGEAIYGTGPWKVYGEGPTEVIAGGFSDTKRKPFTAQDVRFTTKHVPRHEVPAADVLYAIVLGVPEGEIVIRSLGSSLRLYPQQIESVELVGSRSAVSWKREEDALRVTLPADAKVKHAVALRIKPTK
jgi:alpha-L-fucosidase